tara:strand:+ start:44711 stop:45355 length:645 start_codon:yes stop_codon:yes gene_type:complete
MPSGVRVKICGLRDKAGLASAIDAGADYLGFVFFSKSPRNVSIQTARALAVTVPVGIAKVALVVNADNDFLDHLTADVAIDMLQLHGAETPARVSEIKARYGLPVMKAVGVADAADVETLASYLQVADQILVDAKPPKDAALPGGNGLSFDWQLVAKRRWPIPMMLAGGLNPDNVSEAIALSGLRQVDVSSGVETAPGVKDPNLIAQFIRAAKQ